ncbi:hypothetical protein EV424DRAFT_1349819 [Suillus variegatus]|nr:hypothetical protein EV424DRAFT_1349819 [Suillus variegatus]
MIDARSKSKQRLDWALNIPTFRWTKGKNYTSSSRIWATALSIAYYILLERFCTEWQSKFQSKLLSGPEGVAGASRLALLMPNPQGKNGRGVVSPPDTPGQALHPLLKCCAPSMTVTATLQNLMSPGYRGPFPSESAGAPWPHAGKRNLMQVRHCEYE